VGQNDRALALALERLDEVQQKGVIAVLGGRDAVLETVELVVGGVEPVRPGFGGKRRIGDGEVEGFQGAVRVLEVGIGEGVSTPEKGRGVAVQDHVHPGQRPGGVVHLLAVDGDAARGFVGRLEQQRAGAARRVVNGLVLGRLGTNADNLGHDARDFGRRVELAFALAGLGGEVPHQVLVGVAEQVVAFCAVGPEVEAVEDRDELGEAVLHLLAAAELVLVVEVGLVNDALKIVGLGQLADNRVDLVADLLVALQGNHVGESAALRDLDDVVLLSGVLVRHVLYEQQCKDIVLVLRGVHAAAQFIAALPE